MRIIGFVVFIVLQIAMLPLAVLGIMIVTYRQLYLSKKLGVSMTAVEVIHGRWAMHVFGIRDDVATVALAAALPTASPLGFWLLLLPLWVKYKIDGRLFLYPRVPSEGNETIADVVVGRTLYFDRIIERVLPEMRQIVLLGAGYDTRAYGPLRRDGLQFFELDQARTQELKRSALHAAGIDASHVTFVTVDFAVDQVFEELVEAGYDPAARTIFLWEGVTLYLQEGDVRRTLRDIRTHSAPGSLVVADLYSERFITFVNKSYNRKFLDYTGEGMAFGLPFTTEWDTKLDEFVESEELEVGQTHFLGTTNQKGPFMVVAELIVGQDST